MCNVPPSQDPCRVSNMAVVWDLNVVYDPPLLWPGAPILLPTLTYHSQDFSGFRPMGDKKTGSWNLTTLHNVPTEPLVLPHVHSH